MLLNPILTLSLHPEIRRGKSAVTAATAVGRTLPTLPTYLPDIVPTTNGGFQKIVGYPVFRFLEPRILLFEGMY